MRLLFLFKGFPKTKVTKQIKLTVLLRFSSLGKKTKILKSENLWPKIKVILIIAILLRQIWTMLLIVIFIRFKTPYAKKKKKITKGTFKGKI